MIRKLTIITGTRAEYGLLKPLIKSIHFDTDFELQLVVTGMHLSHEFGYTIKEIENDGLPIVKKIECLLSSDSSVGISKSIALGVSGFADALVDLQPDLMILLGDRTEVLAAAIAATSANLPIAHIHGGETTEGAYDEGIRHAITKFSHLHFTSTESYKKRVIQLGENPRTVYNVGAIGLDSIKTIDLYERHEFEKSIGKKLKKNNVLITYHPVTLEKENPKYTFNNILNTLDELNDTLLIFTHANSDKNGRIINNMIEEYVQSNKEKAISFKSLGQLRYLSALKYVDAIIGNSSSGIIEVPYYSIPTINIGDRQKGRVAPFSVLQTGNSFAEIKIALDKSLSKQFRSNILNQKQIYGSGNTTQKITTILKEINSIDLKKKFYNIDFEY